MLGAPPLGLHPASLLELVQGRVERAFAHLQHVTGRLSESLADGPSVHRLESQNPKDQQIEGALKKVGGSTHVVSVTDVKDTIMTLGKQGERVEADSRGSSRASR